MSIRSEVVRIFNELLAGSKKISELPDASTPLAGTEQVELNQGGVSVKTAVSNIGGGGGSQDLQSVLNQGSSASVAAPVSVATSTPDDITLDAGSRLVLKTNGGTDQLTIGADGGWYLSGSDPGTEGQVITSHGAAPPTWETPTGGTPADASETVKGILELATQAEVTTGTDDARAVTPLKLAAATRGIQDLFVSAAAMWARVTGGCSNLTKTEVATSLFNIQSLDFDQTTQEFCQFQITLPRKWNNGTVTAVFYWTAAAGSGDVQWGISGGAYSNDDALAVALGSAQTVDDTLIATNDLHITAATSAITLAGTPADADFLAFQISRNPASDTLSADAKLLGVSIRITTDSALDA